MPGNTSPSLREPQSAERLRRTFSRSLTAVDLAEPLVSLDENQPATLAAQLAQSRNLSVLGVRRGGLVDGWVAPENLTEGTLSDNTRAFSDKEVLDDSAGLDVVLAALSSVDQVFIEWCGGVAGVITRRDLQKPPLRMWLFGAITILDSNLTRAVEELYPNDTWQGRLTTGRFEKASTLFTERTRRGTQCRLVDCLQIKDKADIIVNEVSSLPELGLGSRRETDRLARDIELLRNHLAHAQELEERHLAIATRLASFLDSILHAEFVQRIVESKRAGPRAK
jgi:hypothetical protein